MLPECGSELIHKSHGCDVGPVGHGCVLDAGTYKIQWNDGDQLPFDIYHWLSTRFSGKWCRYEYFSGVDTIFLSLDTRDSGVDTFQ